MTHRWYGLENELLDEKEKEESRTREQLRHRIVPIVTEFCHTFFLGNALKSQMFNKKAKKQSRFTHAHDAYAPHDRSTRASSGESMWRERRRRRSTRVGRAPTRRRVGDARSAQWRPRASNSATAKRAPARKARSR